MCSAFLMPAGKSFQIAGAKYLIPKAARVVSRCLTIKLSASLVSYLWSERFTQKKIGKNWRTYIIATSIRKKRLDNLESDQC